MVLEIRTEIDLLFSGLGHYYIFHVYLNSRRAVIATLLVTFDWLVCHSV